MLSWANRFNIFCFLDNCGYEVSPHRGEVLLAVGSRHIYTHLSSVEQARRRGKWLFGHLSYDLKSILHGLESSKPDPLAFPFLQFFEPQIVIRLQGCEVVIEADEPLAIWTQISAEASPVYHTPGVQLKERLTREAYLDIIRKLQQHIRRGDCYEINFCLELFCEQASIDPPALFSQLMRLSPNPFSAFYRTGDKYLLCASPERFMALEGGRLFSQPIKGTVRRQREDEFKDKALKEALASSEKDRSENVMVVDLVRNDLTQICERGSVKVDELFGIYAFPQVYQMISTVSGILRSGVSFEEILKAMFPMGSMTGAPKLRVMQLIDQYEPQARGIFSGSVGYFSPDGNFDFNVVIRSLMFNAATGYLSCGVGSGITTYSDAQSEWEECMLKVAAIRGLLSGNTGT